MEERAASGSNHVCSHSILFGHLNSSWARCSHTLDQIRSILPYKKTSISLPAKSTKTPKSRIVPLAPLGKKNRRATNKKMFKRPKASDEEALNQKFLTPVRNEKGCQKTLAPGIRSQGPSRSGEPPNPPCLPPPRPPIFISQALVEIWEQGDRNRRSRTCDEQQNIANSKLRRWHDLYSAVKGNHSRTLQLLLLF